MSIKSYIVFLLIWGIFASARIVAQPYDPDSETGYYYIQNFTPKEYGGHAQNWGITQSKDGLIYVANSEAILEYDGVSWRSIPTPQKSRIRFVFAASDGRIYVGGTNEIGYLEPDSLGQMTFHSLLPLIPEKDRLFRDLWTIVETQEGIYFQGADHFFRYSEDSIKVWHTENKFRYAFSTGGTLYTQIAYEGLARIQGDSLEIVPGGEFFSHIGIVALYEKDPSTNIIVTWNQGMFKCLKTSGTTPPCTPYRPELTETLTAAGPYRHVRLQNGFTAIGTVNGGVIILDETEDLFRIIDETTGLQANMVWFTFEDQQGDLWLGLENGISRVSLNAEITYFSKSAKITQSVNSIVRHKGNLYISTVDGIWKLSPAEGGNPPSFTQSLSSDGICFALIAIQNSLLAGCNDSIWDVEKDEQILASDHSHFYSLHRPSVDTTTLLMGLSDGLAKAKYEKDAWHYSGHMGVEETVRSIVEDPDGNIWMGTEEGVVIGLHYQPALDTYHVTRLDTSHGLSHGWVNVFLINNRVLVDPVESEDLFIVEKKGDSFTLDSAEPLFQSMFSHKPGNELSLLEDDAGRVWMFSRESSGVAIPQDGGTYRSLFVEMDMTPVLTAYGMLAENNGVAWIGGPHGLVRLEIPSIIEESEKHTVWIREIATKNDSLLLGGHASRITQPPQWTHEISELRFSYAAPHYRAPNQIKYRTWLEGFDDEWSEWTYKNQKSYTNLNHGTFKFHVQAQNLRGQVSEPVSFSFGLLPPWYHTRWAYLLWMLVVFVGMSVITLSYNRVRSRKIMTRNKVLEARVAARTESLKKTNAELSYANNKLVESNQQLADRTDHLRDALEANKEILGITAHDLKNPLGGIIGLAEMVLLDSEEAPTTVNKSVQENLPMLKEEAERMLHIIKELLDKHRQEGQDILKKERVLLDDIVSTVLRWNDLQAKNKNIVLHCDTCSTFVDVDVVSIQRVLDNYVSNAIKYSPLGTEVWIKMGVVDTPPNEDATLVKISIHDEGPGLTEEDKAKVFGKMQRLSAKPTAGEHSTGLGLYIVKSLIEAHGGEVGVESKPGEGAVFWFTIPIHPITIEQ